MKLIYYIILVLFLYTSCKYTPTATNIQQIAIPVSNIDITFLDTTQINFLRGTIKISYQPSLDGHSYIKSELYIDDSNMVYGSFPEMIFTLNTTQYPDGEHVLKIVLYTSTNTGSLADNLDAEVFVIQKEYKTFFYNAFIPMPAIKQVRDTLGTLKISWDRYNQLAFGKYVVRKFGTVIAEIMEIDCTDYYDNTYVGGNADYTISTVVGGVEIKSYTTTFNDGIPKFSTSRLVADSSKVEVSWTRCKYDSGFFSYRIIKSEHIRDITDINQTTFIDDSSTFGGAFYTLFVTSKNGNIPNEGSTIYPGSIGKWLYSFPDWAHFEYIKATDRSYAIWKNSDGFVNIRLYGDSTFRYQNAIQMYFSTVTDNKTGSDVSSNGKWAYAVFNDYSGHIEKFDPATLITSSPSIMLNEIHPDDWTYTYSISISDNNLLAALGWVNESGGGYQLALFNMSNRQLVAGTKINDDFRLYSYNLQIHNSGEYIINGNTLYKVTGDTIIHVNTILSNALFLGDDKKLIQQTDTKLQILQLSDFSIMREIDVGGDPLLQEYDPKTGFIGCNSKKDGFYYIIDLNAEKIIKKIPISTSRIRFQNGSLIVGGYYLNLHLN